MTDACLLCQSCLIKMVIVVFVIGCARLGVARDRVDLKLLQKLPLYADYL